ncbi:hypothetical protein GCM10023224_16980 [Streptomonospora halophila]|uniref:Transposase, YhgA-like n=1 Tax=Streptomonospora halophila TaxID=427369 RepID=A0ABP9GES1_9ACTN
MPTTEHEMPLEFLRNRPELAALLLERSFGICVPDYDETHLASGDCTDNQPREYRPDGVVVLRNAGVDRLAVVTEVQRRTDERKRYTWPVYLATLRSRLECPAVLLVMCPDPATAKWAGQPIDMGHPNWHLVPLVLGEDRTPVVTSIEEAVAVPELAILSALAHGGEDMRTIVACAEALNSVPKELFKLYYDFVATALSGAARRNWDELMRTTESYQSEFARKYVGIGEAKGEARGEAKAVLRVLESRGIPVPEEARERISSCADLDQLDAWLDRAALVDSVDELFA